MQRSKYKFQKNLDAANQINKYIAIGKCIKIINCEKNYQVIGINPNLNICWVREWPLNFCRYETFELSINNIKVSKSCEINNK
tara:strand:+ start:153 stop:401 length:249 start_codon:yes stop_codon:yes gene_type:complete